MDVRPEQEVGGICSATIIQAHPAKPIQRVSVIFAFMTENTPATFSATPHRAHQHEAPTSANAGLKVSERGEGMCVYSPIPCARDTPCFSATP